MLLLENIEKNYDSLRAVDHVTLKIEDGESVVLVGESGSGKTTLARAAVGLPPADAGKIYLDEKLLKLSCKKRSFDECADIQYIFQDPYSALEADFTLRRTLQETERICARHKREILSAKEVLTYVDARLLAYLDRPVGELSGGQRQKVCVARALMPQPRVIIADESASMLDKKSGQDIFDLLNRIKKEKKISVLAILHDMDLDYKKWDRIAVMWKGKIVEEKAFSEFYETAEHPYSRALIESYEYFNGGKQV